MDYILPWESKFIFVTEGMSREDHLRQRITRAFDKAHDSGVTFNDPAAEWRVQELAEQLFTRLLPHFHQIPPEVK